MDKVHIKVVLVEPMIPPNTGNISRLCAANDLELHLVGKLGFSLDDKHLKRAGLDYWDSVKLFIHKDLDSFIDELACSKRMFFFSKTATNNFFDVAFEDGDILVFGPEDKGFSKELLSKYKNRLVKIPMQTKNVRSLNLSSAVAIAVYEAIRQISNKRTL